MKYWIVWMIVFSLVLFGCQKADENVVDSLSEQESVQVEDKPIINEDSSIDNSESDIVSGNSDEENLDESDFEDEDLDNDLEEIKIILIDFHGEPENIEIDAGETVFFENLQKNFQHVILFREDLGKGHYSKEINSPIILNYNMSGSYKFEANTTGKIFQWYSKTKYPDASGTITIR